MNAQHEIPSEAPRVGVPTPRDELMFQAGYRRGFDAFKAGDATAAGVAAATDGGPCPYAASDYRLREAWVSAYMTCANWLANGCPTEH